MHRRDKIDMVTFGCTQSEHQLQHRVHSHTFSFPQFLFVFGNSISDPPRAFNKFSSNARGNECAGCVLHTLCDTLEWCTYICLRFGWQFSFHESPIIVIVAIVSERLPLQCVSYHENALASLPHCLRTRRCTYCIWQFNCIVITAGNGTDSGDADVESRSSKYMSHLDSLLSKPTVVQRRLT